MAVLGSAIGTVSFPCASDERSMLRGHRHANANRHHLCEMRIQTAVRDGHFQLTLENESKHFLQTKRYSKLLRCMC